ncbi:hypothetical protein H5410_036818 [Solanum commersonii]|uniref:Uncharacterized protein n=1 Tax=Solanum commersonii TaxID=4109 RepID=A0A9J5Y6B5_SOLCO|nr:hypothetical protein H5410_036818 [Solanum commersonii]
MVAHSEGPSGGHLPRPPRWLMVGTTGRGDGRERLVPSASSAVPDPLRATMDVSISDVWITDCTIVSSRPGRPP